MRARGNRARMSLTTGRLCTTSPSEDVLMSSILGIGKGAGGALLEWGPARNYKVTFEQEGTPPCRFPKYVAKGSLALVPPAIFCRYHYQERGHPACRLPGERLFCRLDARSRLGLERRHRRTR